jgi:hypothetical protein
MPIYSATDHFEGAMIAVHVHPYMSWRLMGIAGTAAYIFNFNARWKWVVIFLPRPFLSLEKESLLPIK